MLIAPGRDRALPAGVAALVAWSAAEGIWLWTFFDAGVPDLVGILGAAMLPLPLLLVPRAPMLAGLGVILLVLARSALDLRAPGTTAQSLLILIALFAVEAQGTRAGRPVRGAAVGGVLLAGVVAMDLADTGDYAEPVAAGYAHLIALVAGGVGAGYALRDRGREAERLERELDGLDARGAERVDSLIARERRRIAAELEATVALLLHTVRPLAARAARAADPAAIAADMAAVQRSARAAMAEMRRALHLLRGPVPDPGGADLATAVAASRRTRVRHALGWVAPVALLAAVGIVDHAGRPGPPGAVPMPDGLVIPAPVLGMTSGYVTAVICVLPLLLRARAPVAATLGVCALLIARMELHDLSTLSFTQFYVAAAAGFLGAAHARTTAGGVVVVAAAAATSVVCMVLEQQAYEAFAYSFILLLPLASGVAGLLVRHRVATAARARRAREEVDRGHEAAARERLVAERLQAARELHDVVGHAVTIVGLQAAAAVTLSGSDPERARAAAATVTQVTGDAERDLAQLGAVLGADAGAQAPAPSLAVLVDRVSAAGLPVTLDQRVPDGELPLAVALTAFRIVQEALTNVRRHAGTVVTVVTVTRADAAVVVEVVNGAGPGAAGPGGGRGVLGMRERAELYGGRLDVGPVEGGGWRVRAELPLAGEAGTGAAGPLVPAGAQRPFDT